MRTLVPPFFLALTAAGCAQGGDFPSLRPRPVELLSMEEPVRSEPAVAGDPALRSRAAELLAQARAGDGAFDAAYAEALPRVRAASAANSDSWVQAQEAISRVEASRRATTAALADLDRLLVDQADEPTSRADHEALVAARRAAEQLMLDQQRRVNELRRSVSAS